MIKLLAVLLVWFPITSVAGDCDVAYQRHLATDLDLSYERFDQTPGSGFRVLAKLGCHKEAADLIERYITANQAKQNSLRWHVAQLLATAGDYPGAIASAKMSLKPTEDFSKNPLRWNAYVLATIAFLELDQAALLEHRNEVAKGADDYFGNRLNLRLLDALQKHIGQSYQYATEHIE